MGRAGLSAKEGEGRHDGADQCAEGSADRYGAYFHCQTTLLESFRHLYPEAFSYEGARAILFRVGEPYPVDALKHCLRLALTYHLKDQATTTGGL